jgi:hypothetical protein
MNAELLFILLATFGAVCQEVLYWYELRNKLDDETIREVLYSKSYWIITLLMIVISGIGTWILFYDEATKKSIPFVMGASFPLLFKKIVQTTVSSKSSNKRKTVKTAPPAKAPARRIKMDKKISGDDSPVGKVIAFEEMEQNYNYNEPRSSLSFKEVSSIYFQ